MTLNVSNPIVDSRNGVAYKKRVWQRHSFYVKFHKVGQVSLFSFHFARRSFFKITITFYK